MFLGCCCMNRTGPTKRSCAKELWKRRLSLQSSTDPNLALSDPEEQEDKASLHSLLKRLSHEDLEGLVLAIQSKDREPTACVQVPSGAGVGKRGESLQHFAARLWRWRDLSEKTHLKNFPCCMHRADTECINPYHVSRILKVFPPESVVRECGVQKQPMGYMEPPPRYTSRPICADTEFDSGGGLADGSYSCCTSGGSPQWCQLAYWELRQRLGSLFPVHARAVDVFQNTPHADGLCLSALHDRSAALEDQVRRTRQRIGAGVCLARFGPEPRAPVQAEPLKPSRVLAPGCQVLDACNNVDSFCGACEEEHGDCSKLKDACPFARVNSAGVVHDDDFEGNDSLAPTAADHCGDDESSAATVWLFNKSDSAVFVASTSLCRSTVEAAERGSPVWPSTSAPWRQVHKVPPNYCLKVYDYRHASGCYGNADTHASERLARCQESWVCKEDAGPPGDPHSVLVSFVKGWGAGYTRQSITSAPCWLEVLINAKVDDR